MMKDFPLSPEDLDNLDPDLLTVQEMKDLLIRLDSLYENMQALEPEDMESEEYDEWEDSLEEIDDLIDDIRDRLEDSK